MTTKLSTKGQIVLPKRARALLRLQAGAMLLCKVQGGAILLTPETPPATRPKFITDPKSGLRITKSPARTAVTSAEVRAALLEFP